MLAWFRLAPSPSPIGGTPASSLTQGVATFLGHYWGLYHGHGHELEISSQCGRLIATAIIYDNSAILSRLLTRYEASGNAKARALSTQISPAAWRHILLNGHDTFHSDGTLIDLDAIVAALDLG